MDDGISVIKFGAKWCSSCKQADTVMKGFSRDITNYDTDENPDMVAKYNIVKHLPLDGCSSTLTTFWSAELREEK